jgi:hypothetical protein
MSEWEYADLSKPRTVALREFERIKRGWSVSDCERRLAEIAVEILESRCKQAERDRHAAAATRTHRDYPPRAGWASLLCGDTIGELVAGR